MTCLVEPEEMTKSGWSMVQMMYLGLLPRSTSSFQSGAVESRFGLLCDTGGFSPALRKEMEIFPCSNVLDLDRTANHLCNCFEYLVMVPVVAGVDQGQLLRRCCLPWHKAETC